MSGIQSLINRKSIGGNLLFVKFNIGDLFTVRGPLEGLVKLKLLLVNPVRNSVNDLVYFTINGHLTFGAKPQTLYEQIVVPHKCNPFTVGREGGNLLPPRRKTGQFLGYEVVNKINCSKRAAIDLFPVSKQQYFCFVTAEHIFAHRTERIIFKRLNVKNQALSFPGLVTVLYNLFSSIFKGCIT